MLKAKEYCVQSSNVLKGSPSSSPGNCHQENPLHLGPGGEKLICRLVTSVVGAALKEKENFLYRSLAPGMCYQGTGRNILCR